MLWERAGADASATAAETPALRAAERRFPIDYSRNAQTPAYYTSITVMACSS